jgi:predicted N-acetyltransferase YhbS
MTGLSFRQLARHEVESVWTIDRAELVENVYYYEEGGLVLKPERYDMKGWPKGESEFYTPILLDCHARGGVFEGAFDGDKLVGVYVLESKFIGREGDQLQLKFLHVSRSHRGRGLGVELFERAARKAKALGARKLYVSSTPSENTVGFYLRRGCILAREIDSELFELEPADIHLEYVIQQLDGCAAERVRTKEEQCS